MDSTSTVQESPKVVKPAFPSKTLLITAADLATVKVCPTAISLLARTATDDHYHLFALSCKRWSCRICAQARIRILSARTRDATPTRLLTLTLSPSLYTDPADAFRRSAPLIPRLMRSLRNLYGEVEYLRVTEAHKNGFPHYHLLIRSGYLPHNVVKNLWNQLTGATIIDLRQVKQSFKTFTYLVKYLSKLHDLEWTDRHVSYSRHFFKENSHPHVDHEPWASTARDKTHPYVFLDENYRGLPVDWVSATHWHLVHDPLSTPVQCDLDTLTNAWRFDAPDANDPVF